jgi:hypothetical protein
MAGWFVKKSPLDGEVVSASCSTRSAGPVRLAARYSPDAPRLRRQQVAANKVEIRQREETEGARQVLGEATVAYLGEAPEALHDVKRVLAGGFRIPVAATNAPEVPRPGNGTGHRLTVAGGGPRHRHAARGRAEVGRSGCARPSATVRLSQRETLNSRTVAHSRTRSQQGKTGMAFKRSGVRLSSAPLFSRV